MAQPRRPKGESGPAKSSKHHQKAVESGLYEDTNRMSALQSLLGASTTASSSSQQQKSSTTKKSSKKSSARDVEADPSAVKVNKKSTLAAVSTDPTSASGGGLPVSTITSEDIVALLSRIDKKSSGELQVLRSVNTLVTAYALPKISKQQQQEQQDEMGAPSPSDVSSISTASTTATACCMLHPYP